MILFPAYVKRSGSQDRYGSYRACFAHEVVSPSYTNLGHVLLRRSEATKTTPPILEAEERASDKGSPEEPHKRRARLDLPTPLLVIIGAKGDPVPPIVANVAAVGRAELRGQQHAGHKGEEHGEHVKRDGDEGDGQEREQGGAETPEAGGPRPGRGEHGVVDGLGGGAGAVDVAGDDVADEGGDEECPQEGGGAEGCVDDAGHGCGYGIIRDGFFVSK